MKGEKKMTLDEMASEMCGKYCRYPKEYDEEVMEVTMFDEVCSECPMVRYIEEQEEDEGHV